MRKKLILFLLVTICCVALAFGLAACNTNENSSDGYQQGTTQSPSGENNSSENNNSSSGNSSSEGSSSSSNKVELTASQIYQKVNPSVVFILIAKKSSFVSGSGFFIDFNGTLVTNYHVIKDGLTGVLQLNNGETATIQTVLGYNETLDIAILSTSAKNTIPAILGNSSEVQVGDTVYAIGYPEAFEVGFSSSTFTTGMVSMNRSIGGYNYIQSTVDITNGNSGGALINTYGEVIGITTAGLNVGNVDYMNLSIPVQRIETVSRNVNETLEILTKRHYPVYVTYQTDNTVYQKQTLKYEETATKPTVPTKTGYTFENWYADKGCTKLFDFNTKIIADTTVYAKFNVKSYRVTYSLVSGSWNGSAPQSTYTINDCNKALPLPIRSGYLFEGWTDNSGNYIDNFPASAVLNDLSLTANWIQGAEGLIISGNKVIGYEGTEKNIIVPSFYRNETITGIDRYIFNGNNDIVSLSFPTLDKRIGELFSRTSFEGAQEITQKTGVGNYDYEKSYISSKLKKVVIRGGSVVIGCFSGCSLEEITLGEDVKAIGANAFGNVDKLALGKHMSVSQYTFSESNISEIYIDSLDEWLKFNFGGNGYITQSWSSPFNKNTKLFINNSLLTKLVIPDSITEINEGIFRNYQYLTEVIISKQVIKIKGYAFSGCVNLKSATFEQKDYWYTQYLGYTTASDKLMQLNDVTLNSKNLVSYVHYIWYKTNVHYVWQ